MRIALRMMLGMTLLASSLIASAWFLNGIAIRAWIDAFLYLAIGAFFVSQVDAALPEIERMLAKAKAAR